MKKKILLVDDEQDLLSVMGMRIKSWGYDLATAETGKDAITAINNENPDIVILDHMMPDMDGITTLKEIRKTNNSIPVIMFTAFQNAKSIKGVEELGVSFCIPKLSMFPSSESALKTAIRTIEKEMQA